MHNSWVSVKFFCAYLDSLGGTNFWNRLQNIHNCGAGDTLWDIIELGIGRDLLGWRGDGDYLMEGWESRESTWLLVYKQDDGWNNSLACFFDGSVK